MKQGFVSLFVGILFGLGLAISGMTQPEKVISFLDIFGDWDPSLAFVMAGAIAVHFIAYRIKKKRTSPLLTADFSVPTNTKIDGKLILGSAMFGVGWAIGGFCPGPAIVSLITLKAEPFIFVLSMTAGMFAHHYFEKATTKKA